ncbi:MAG: hypothetical protein O3A63_07815 [Proteobacteria bacterium]|nr:hypothetical protein [Pseudomonadota bacterium]
MKEDPAAIKPLIASGVARVWLSRGGGLYGLGYLTTLIVMEVHTIISIIYEAPGVGEVFKDKLIDLLTRSFENTISALIWPFYVLELGLWGIAILVISFVAYNRYVNPLIEARFTDLAAGKEALRAEKALKKQAKANKRSRKPPK